MELQSGFFHHDSQTNTFPKLLGPGARINELRRSQGIGKPCLDSGLLFPSQQASDLYRCCADAEITPTLFLFDFKLLFCFCFPSILHYSDGLPPLLRKPPAALQLQSPESVPDAVIRCRMIHRLSTYHTRTIWSLIHRGEQTNA